MGKGLENWANEHASQIAAVAIAAGTVLTVAALVATGPVGLIVARAAVGAERAGAKAVALGQKAASAMKINPMRYVNSWRAGKAAGKAAELGARAERFAQVADRMGDVGGFARSMAGQTVQGVASNVMSNNLAYAWGDFKEHTVGGYVRATVSGVGVGVGVVSPRITPLRENFVRGTTPVTSFAGTGIDKSADYLVGIANYIVTPQEDAFSWEDANKEGLKNMANGSVGSTSTVWADHIRPIQGK